MSAQATSSGSGKADADAQHGHDSVEHADADPKAKDHSANGKANDAADSTRHGDKTEADKPTSDKSHQEDDAAHHDDAEHPKDTDSETTKKDADPKSKDHSANGKADDAADSARHGDKTEADKPTSDKSHQEDDAAHHDDAEHPKDTDDKHTTKNDDADSKSPKDEADTHKSDKDEADTHKSDKDDTDGEGSGSHDGNESSDDEPAFADGITAGGHPGPYKEANDGFIADFAEKNGHTLDTDHGPIGADLVDHRKPISTDPDTGEQISAELYKERATGPDGKTDWPNVKKHPELADVMIDGVYLHGDPEKGIPPFQDMAVDEFIKEYPGNLDRIGGDYGEYFALVGKDGPDSFQKRSIHADSLYAPYSQFEFHPERLPPGTRVETGIVYPWFDSPGGSRQVRRRCQWVVAMSWLNASVGVR